VKSLRSIEESKAFELVAEADGIEEYRLAANGMKVLLVENRVAPVATFLVLYKVGSRNEAVGHTGATHLLEHMMFKGTPTFNKANNTQIAATLQKIGAAFNATTWYDRTNYFETVPSDQLELAIRLEADRMRNSLIADSDRQSEMTVVRNELERGQNEPMMVLDEAVYATAFREHPYHHPTIGWRDDVENVPTARLKEFYDTFYHPSNATAILVGDFERDHALDLIKRHFGDYPASTEPIPEVYTSEPEQQGERRLVIRRAGELALIQIAFRAPAALGQTRVLSNEELAARAAAPPEQNDIFPLVTLAAAMSNGVTSRLYQALVEKQLAVHQMVNCDQFRDPGLFNIYITVQPGIEPRTVEEAILSEIKRITEEGLTEAEIEKVKQQISASIAYGRDGTQGIAMMMSEAEAIADWRFFKDYIENINRVTNEDIKRAAATYLTEDNRTVGYFIPKSTHAASNGHKENGNGRNGNSLMIVPHGWKFYRDPQHVTAEEAGESVTPQARAQQIVAPRGDKSSDAAEANTPESVGRSNFASRVRRTQLQNGAILLALENQATPTVAIRGSFRAGSYFEPRDKPGLASITASMLERGTRRHTKLEIAEALESVGAELSLSADPFSVHIGARSLTKDLPRVVSTLAEVLREPSFPADELEKLKEQTIAAIQEQQSNTRARAYERFTQLIFSPDNPFYSHTGARLIESVNSITVEDLQDFYTARYGGRSLILAVTGDTRGSNLEEIFADSFGSFEGPDDIEINVADAAHTNEMRRETVIVKEKFNIDVILGSAASLRRNSEDYYAAVLANSALGQSTLSSRLGLEVRDREGLTYGINSRFRSPGLAAGPWYIGVSLNRENVERALTSTVRVLRDYVENGIREDELADEKSSAIGSFKVALSTNAGISEALWVSEFYNLGTNYVDRYPQLIEAVTAGEVNTAIRKHFRPDALTIVVAGDYQHSPTT
jgi:zinc protease